MMSEETKIQWCDSTWNWVVGCSKVSEGCAHCYAKEWARRFGRDFSKRKPTSKAAFNAPLKWHKKPWVCDMCGHAVAGDLSNCPACDADLCEFHRRRVFSLSLGDWLDHRISPPVFARAMDIVRRCADIDFLMLTKRPQNFAFQLYNAKIYTEVKSGCNDLVAWLFQWMHGNPPANVWVGTSIESNKHDQRIIDLLKIPARIHFLSLEPLLGPVDLTRVYWPDMHGGDKWENCLIDPVSDYAKKHFESARQANVPFVKWVIVGGESGPKARPCDVRWIRSIVQQCKAANVPCFVKQLGSNVVGSSDGFAERVIRRQVNEAEERRIRLKHPKGGDPDEWPADLRVREFPISAGGVDLRPVSRGNTVLTQSSRSAAGREREHDAACCCRECLQPASDAREEGA